MTIVTFWALKKQWPVAFVMLLLFSSTLPLAAAASSKSSCPTTGKHVFVVMVDANPKSATVGTTVVTTVAVSSDSITWTAFALSPETISFRWVSAAGEKIIENAPVVPAGTGLYEYEQKVEDDFPTETVTIFVVACSCSDGQGNYGPPVDVNSESTIHEKDGSKIEIGATAAASSAGIPGFPMESILIGLVAAFAILLLRRRHTGKTYVVWIC